MIWCLNPVIDVDEVSILTNDVIEDGKVAMQLNVVIVGVVRTCDVLTSTDKVTDDDVTIPINDVQYQLCYRRR